MAVVGIDLGLQSTEVVISATNGFRKPIFLRRKDDYHVVSTNTYGL